ncbi:MAG: capsule assembly Wzi family protein [Paludibacter sp.]|nr:capsule assembly Wzi family protein [Paludibacter sp.]
MIIRYFRIFLLVLIPSFIQAQESADTVSYSLNTRFNVGSGTHAPFLSTANEYDRYSFAPNSISLWGNVHKALKNTRALDYGFGLELDGNIAKGDNRFLANECYIQGKFYFLNMYVGKKQEVFPKTRDVASSIGNQDAELSSGGMLWSQNARPMPKISIETNGYVDVPYTSGVMAVKAGISHGWFDNNNSMKDLLLHHKYAYVKVGGSFPVSINYGVQHVAQWGGVSTQYGSMPVTWNNYYRIFFGKSGGSTANMSDQINTLGKHMISQNLGLDLNLKSVLVSLYWQNLTEDPPVRFITSTMNVQDGLWGMSIRLPCFKPLHSFVLEYLSTTDHSGPWHDLDGVIFGGIDPYYLNGQAHKDWTYKGMTIGNPWITSPKYNPDGSTTILNNTVRLYYFSGKGTYKSLDYRLTLAYSENFGLANISNENNKRQLSYQFETSTPLNFLKNTNASIALSGDHGAMYGNNLSVMVGLSWKGALSIEHRGRSMR